MRLRDAPGDLAGAEPAQVIAGFDANGIPDRKGYTAPRLSPAQVRQQDNAARQARAQAAADLKAAAAASKASAGGSIPVPAGVTSKAEYTATVKALQQQRQHGVYYPGCNPQLFHIGACPSEAGAAGTTPGRSSRP